ncbi:MAG: DUF4097 domain-containing protein [Bacteroidales bacterium]|nr:DUF4097 domain-containing protein [Candidatus Latescibacterota bacterium]
MKKTSTMIIAMLIVALCASAGFTRGDDEVIKRFDDVKRIRISTVSGDCLVKTHKSNEVIVELYRDVYPEDAMDYRIKESGGKLIIKEEWHGRSSSGEVKWTLTVPADIDIEFSTASGDFEISGVSGDVEVSTASGDISAEDMDGELDVSTASGEVRLIDVRGEKEVSTASGDIYIENVTEEVELSTASGDIEAVNVEGDIELSTASGDIEVSDSKGIFSLSTASGTVKAYDIIIDGNSRFSTASGSVKVRLSETSEYDMDLSTASGNVSLDYNGNEVIGYFEFKARKRRGRIVSPFDFDDEEEYRRHGDDWVRKWFSKKGDDPSVILSTASGTVTLKK